MGIFDRLMSKIRREEQASAPPPKRGIAAPASVDEPPSSRVPHARLRDLGAEGGPDTAEAIAILRLVQGTPNERLAIRLIRAAGNAAPEALLVACAELLATRGQEREALRVLAGLDSTPALMLAADLNAESGNLGQGVCLIERVLVRDLEVPGARERHVRWRASLGMPLASAAQSDDATVLTSVGAEAPYRLLREVARGGAGTVYEAQDDVLSRRVAFKIYHRGDGDHSLLLREAKLATRLAGPGIVRVYDASPELGWVAMEWVGGGSVRDALRAGRSLAPLSAWVVPLAQALSRIHRAGIVHGDIKPGNVLLRGGRDAVLTDFGVSREVGEARGGGSPGYLSPERFQGAPALPGDDVYGFGRVVEDVLAMQTQQHRGEPDAVGLARVSRECMLPSAHRPADGAAIVEHLRRAGVSLAHWRA